VSLNVVLVLLREVELGNAETVSLWLF
jgi:hypothetical protein